MMLKTLVKSGVDIKGKNIVIMRFDLQEEIKCMLTCDAADEYEEIYENVTQKGYTFESMVEEVMKESRTQNSKMELMAKEMAEMKEKYNEQLEEANRIIENKE